MHWIDFQKEIKHYTKSADLGTDAAQIESRKRAVRVYGRSGSWSSAASCSCGACGCLLYLRD